MSVVLQLLYDIKAPSWITGNTMIPALNEPVYISDGRYAFGDGVTQVQSLTFFAGAAGSGTVTSVDASATGALSFSGGPITGAGTLALAWAGSSSQYVLGDGSLATLNSSSKINWFGKPSYWGDSITVGIGATSISKRWVNQLSGYNQEDSNNVFNQYAVSGTGALANVLSVYANQDIYNEYANSKMASFMFGHNDIMRNGSQPTTLLKVIGCFRASLVNTFLRKAFAASAVSNTGTWTSWTVLVSKSANPGIGGNALQSSVIGSTITLGTVPTTNVVIGTYNTDGTVKNYGRFTVKIDGVVVYTFDPNGRTDGVSDGSHDNTVTPEALIFNNLGFAAHTVIITTLDAKPTVIDYIGWLNAPQKCSGVMVWASSKCTAAAYSGTSGSDAAMDSLNSQLFSLIDSEFSQFPIVKVNVEKFGFNPNTQTSDGEHPNDIGNGIFFNAAQSHISTATSGLYSTNEIAALTAPELILNDLSRSSGNRRLWMVYNTGLFQIGNANDTMTGATIRMTMDSSTGNWGIGTAVPTALLHLNGGAPLRVVDGNQASGKVLTSDSLGNASWQSAAGGTPSLTSTYVGYGDGSNLLTGAATMTFDTSGLNVGNATRTNQRYLRIGQGSAWVDFGSIVGFPSYGAMYINQTPAFNNYAIIGDVGLTQMNSTGTVQFSISDNVKVGLTTSEFQLVSGVNLRLGNAFTAGAPTNTTVGYVTMKDSGGNLVQVVCWK